MRRLVAILATALFFCSCSESNIEETRQNEIITEANVWKDVSIGAFIRPDGGLRLIINPSIESEFDLYAASSNDLQGAVELTRNKSWRGQGLFADYYDPKQFSETGEHLIWYDDVSASNTYRNVYIDFPRAFQEMDEWFFQDDCPFSSLTVHLRIGGSAPGQHRSIRLDCDPEAVGCNHPEIVDMNHGGSRYCPK